MMEDRLSDKVFEPGKRSKASATHVDPNIIKDRGGELEDRSKLAALSRDVDFETAGDLDNELEDLPGSAISTNSIVSEVIEDEHGSDTGSYIWWPDEVGIDRDVL